MYVDLTRSSVDLLHLRKQSLATNSDTMSVSLILEDGTTYSEKGVWNSLKWLWMNLPAQ